MKRRRKSVPYPSSRRVSSRDADVMQILLPAAPLVDIVATGPDGQTVKEAEHRWDAGRTRAGSNLRTTVMEFA